MNCKENYFSSQEQIAYFLTQEAVYFLVHFKFLRVLDNLGWKIHLNEYNSVHMPDMSKILLIRDRSEFIIYNNNQKEKVSALGTNRETFS